MRATIIKSQITRRPTNAGLGIVYVRSIDAFTGEKVIVAYLANENSIEEWIPLAICPDASLARTAEGWTSEPRKKVREALAAGIRNLNALLNATDPANDPDPLRN